MTEDQTGLFPDDRRMAAPVQRLSGGQARRTRSTSRAAADEIADAAPLLRGKALAVIERSRGMTADEVAERLRKSVLSIRPRITELAREHMIRDSGARRPNASGRNAIVWSPVYPAHLKGQRK